jgi:hypothetical protein
MSEPAARRSSEAAATKPGDLRALVEEMAQWRHAPVAGTHLIALSIAGTLPENKRPPELLEPIQAAMAGIAQRARGRLYRPTPGDFVIMAKADEGGMVALVRDVKIEILRLIEQAFPGSFGTIDQSRLVVCYDLVHNYRSAADRVTRFAETQRLAEEGGEQKLRPLTSSDIERVLQAYKKFGAERFVKAFVRSQTAMTMVNGAAPKPLMTEFFISMDLLRKPLFIDIEMRGSGRLFNEFTLVLDQIILEAFHTIAIEGALCSLNLNVQSVFTKEFDAFLARTPPEKMKNVVFEFRQANIVEHFDEYQIARGVIKERGGRIAVDQIFPQTVGLVDIDYLGASIAKIHWRRGADEVLAERERALKYLTDCGVLPMLIRVDDPRALEVGATMGINAFQGFLIDSKVEGRAPAAASAG